LLITSTTKMLNQENTTNLYKLLSPNLALHAVIEKDIQTTDYGELTYVVELKDGVADMSTLNITIRKRYKY